MSEMKFTSGPWRLVWWGNEKYPYPLSILADNDGAWIARDGTISNADDGPLIASAPDLYGAAKNAVAVLKTAKSFVGDAVGSVPATYQASIDELRAALAKAEGRS